MRLWLKFEPCNPKGHGDIALAVKVACTRLTGKSDMVRNGHPGDIFASRITPVWWVRTFLALKLTGIITRIQRCLRFCYRMLRTCYEYLLCFFSPLCRALFFWQGQSWKFPQNQFFKHCINNSKTKSLKTANTIPKPNLQKSRKQYQNQFKNPKLREMVLY